MATMDDVAKRANVSRMTVSRVINNSGYVKEETRQRINEAIEDLKFKPNMFAKGLVTRKSRSIAYVMVNISNQYHNMVSKGFEAEAFEHGYTTMMCDAHTAGRVTDYVNMLKERCIDGVLLHHLAITEEQVRELESAGIHCVIMDNETDLDGVNSVNTDNKQGGRLAAEHLLSKGHTRIACIHGALYPIQRDSLTYEETFQFNIWKKRTEGFQSVMREAGLPDHYLYQGRGFGDVTLTNLAIDQMFAEKERPTALYCENDFMAMTAIGVLQERGVRIPEDMAVIGHDGLEFCRIVHPYLTTIAQPRYQLGKTAAETLVQCIEKKKEKVNLVLPPSVQEGETT